MTLVLDASAVLAVIFEEAGADIVLASSRDAKLSAVNLDEVLHKSARRRIAAHDVEAQLDRLLIAITPFDMHQARVAAQLHPRLQGLGISFADRACLALAHVTNRSVLSADKDWAALDIGIDIRLIR
ncbi:MAG TPA: type II toxin-antitoxin system VapC family toxin [Sphingomonas sp.]|jgi:PIN domain nuclease of toxin-antitoxin system